MRRFLVCTFGCAAMLAAMGISAQESVAQNTGPVDRGAGNGSMGMGDGIGYPAESSRDADAPDRQKPKWIDAQNPDPKAETGHGGNETDMEHRRRPRLGDD
ncbi:hypothetical protein ACYCFC_09480 [Stutzerimonas sp. NM35]|uniref:hypothetical protein n=1 Tax=Stutzerimonas stutzeri TaxID=316 RepID=UPI0015E37522|nr:hypothetical protein [Stutzerimonas stutzeri]MBA1264720.1 hypothetical protein [Stutzerimonas stutzeri]